MLPLGLQNACRSEVPDEHVTCGHAVFTVESYSGDSSLEATLRWRNTLKEGPDLRPKRLPPAGQCPARTRQCCHSVALVL